MATNLPGRATDLTPEGLRAKARDFVEQHPAWSATRGSLTHDLTAVLSTIVAEARRAQREADAQRPLIVCLCGSTRFFAVFQEANLQETVSGKIVLSIGCDLRSDHQLWADPSERENIKHRLDVLHCRKIDLADEVLILNVGGYIGNSTRREILYALSRGKPIRWWEPDSADSILAALSAQETP